jgi:phosphoribosylformylglycinamidine synthase
VTADSNPNGSVANVAGLCNEARNVVGLMPHPERACEVALGSADGLAMLQSAVQWLPHRTPAPVAVRGASSLNA